MNEILKDLVNEGHVVVYLDDILIFSNSLEEHRKLVCRVLSVLREHKLFLKPEKCEEEMQVEDTNSGGSADSSLYTVQSVLEYSNQITKWNSKETWRTVQH